MSRLELVRHLEKRKEKRGKKAELLPRATRCRLQAWARELLEESDDTEDMFKGMKAPVKPERLDKHRQGLVDMERNLLAVFGSLIDHHKAEKDWDSVDYWKESQKRVLSVVKLGKSKVRSIARHRLQPRADGADEGSEDQMSDSTSVSGASVASGRSREELSREELEATIERLQEQLNKTRVGSVSAGGSRTSGPPRAANSRGRSERDSGRDRLLWELRGGGRHKGRGVIPCTPRQGTLMSPSSRGGASDRERAARGVPEPLAGSPSALQHQEGQETTWPTTRDAEKARGSTKDSQHPGTKFPKTTLGEPRSTATSPGVESKSGSTAKSRATPSSESSFGSPSTAWTCPWPTSTRNC